MAARPPAAGGPYTTKDQRGRGRFVAITDSRLDGRRSIDGDGRHCKAGCNGKLSHV
jgi:hypothetical protein